jgi:HD-GYP domain-containing protein (c-di-GMP phosphodiesterase class II)
MKKTDGPKINLSDLRLGLYVHLDLGWMDHPFPLGSFKITSQQQIDTIRTLGLQKIRYSPEKSDPAPEASGSPQVSQAAQTAHAAQAAQAAQVSQGLPTADDGTPPADAVSAAVGHAHAALNNAVQQEQQRKRVLLANQQAGLQQCERQFADSARCYQSIMEGLESQPQRAYAKATTLIQGMLSDMTSQEECAIRLLSENVGDRFAQHSVNATVLSLLLGKAMNLPDSTLEALGMASLLHDMGKQRLPDRVRFPHENFSQPETRLYQDHVAQGVTLGKALGLSPEALLTIAQHHEMVDGSGFPLACRGDKMVPSAHVLALVNRYDNLCNPPNPVLALTPHEALALIFARMQARFDKATLSAFIRMMGIYPPGSLVQLSDERYGLVMSVNATNPLKPLVLVHDDAVPLSEAIYLDMNQTPHLTVLRSLKPQQLPRAALEYLTPRQRVCYYFERAVEASDVGDSQ